MIETFNFPLPPTLNNQINLARSHWSKSSSVKKEWTNKIALLSRNKTQFTGKVWLEFTWYVKSFARDADNISASAKYIMDGLVKAGIIKNDNLTIIQSPVVHWYKKGDDYVIINISDKTIFEEV